MENAGYLDRELKFTATRSSGPGGQNVNKVNTRVELRFNVPDSEILTEAQKNILLQKLKNRINAEGELVLSSGTERSQLKNRTAVTERFYSLLANALKPVKKRKPGAPTLSSKIKRMERKKLSSVKKLHRKKPEIPE
jgi:ribosome-associated protein